MAERVSIAAVAVGGIAPTVAMIIGTVPAPVVGTVLFGAVLGSCLPWAYIWLDK